MGFEKQEELRNKYTLICRGALTLRNIIEVLTRSKSTGDPFFDESEEARLKLLMVVNQASQRAAESEIEALVAEYGPDARRVLE
jgi:DnaJ-domain-containing protein 1